MAGSGPIFLLDGNSLVFRAFFALPTDLATTGGQVTNAVLGFTSIFVNMLPRPRSERRRSGVRPARADLS